MLSVEREQMNRPDVSCESPEIANKEPNKKHRMKHDELQYLKLIRDIIDRGTEKMDRTGLYAWVVSPCEGGGEGGVSQPQGLFGILYVFVYWVQAPVPICRGGRGNMSDLDWLSNFCYYCV